MRIIAGSLKGRKLNPFRGSTVRPTADRVREALFSILAHKPVEATVLDLFAGSGALGIEAISRGAKQVVFVDNATHSLSLIRHNLENCGVANQATVLRCDVASGLDCLERYPHTFGLVFMDPPYGQNLVPIAMEHLLTSGCLGLDATLLAEHEPHCDMAGVSPVYRFIDCRRYGQTCLSFFQLDRQ